ncbi:MAG: hypothetical protein Tsb0032_07690 [Kiloniellaceae bacterium]
MYLWRNLPRGQLSSVLHWLWGQRRQVSAMPASAPTAPLAQASLAPALPAEGSPETETPPTR